LPGGNDCQDVEQENEQVIGMPRFGRKRFLVNQLKVDHPRSARFLVKDNIRHRRITVRPGAAKFITPELMSSAIFARGCLQHLPSKCATIHVFPKAFARHLVDTNCVCARRGSAKAIAVQHFETLHFPALPVFGLAPKADRYA
jgi:hypothetical protein